MPAEKLSKMFGSARYAISTEENRYYLNGIFFHVLEDELLAVATDGHRLARITSNKPEGIEIDGIIIPRKCVGEVIKIVDADDRKNTSMNSRHKCATEMPHSE